MKKQVSATLIVQVQQFLIKATADTEDIHGDLRVFKHVHDHPDTFASVIDFGYPVLF